MWNAVHCESVVAYSSHAVQTICGRPLYMNYMTSENRLSPEKQARASSVEKQQATRYPENSLFFCGCVVSTWKINDSDAHCLPVYTSSVFWLLSDTKLARRANVPPCKPQHAPCHVLLCASSWPLDGTTSSLAPCFGAIHEYQCVYPQPVTARTPALALRALRLLNSFVVCCTLCAGKCVCTVVVQFAGGRVGDRHLATVSIWLYCAHTVPSPHGP